MKFKYDKEAGWTFIETIVSIGIVIALSSVAGIGAIKYLGKADTASAKNQIESFSIALSTYYLDCRTYPTEEQGIWALWEKPASDADGWDGPYLTKKPKNDPWDNEYEYTVPGPGGLPFGIRSFGADKTEGGEGNDQDVSSWE